MPPQLCGPGDVTISSSGYLLMKWLSRWMICLVVALAALGITPAPVRAALIVSGETVNATPGSTGFVQVVLTNSFATPQTISGFSVEIALGGAGVHFTGVDDQTSPAFVFDGVGTGTLAFDTFPNTGFILSDVVDLNLNPDGFVTVPAGQTVGLGRLAFSVDTTATGGLRPITFTPAGDVTLFTDAANATYAPSTISMTNGAINVQGSVAAIPEPSSALLWLGGACCGLLAAWRKRRLSASSTASALTRLCPASPGAPVAATADGIGRS